MNILIFLERMLGFDFPVPVEEEEHLEDYERAVQRIVAGSARGNISLQNGRFITEQDVENLRKINQKHNLIPYLVGRFQIKQSISTL